MKALVDGLIVNDEKVVSSKKTSRPECKTIPYF